MYLADGENSRTRAFNANLDFTEILDFPKVESGMTLDENLTIKNIECKVLNGRKVNFRVQLELVAKVFLNETEEMIREIEGIDDLETQKISLKMNTLVGENMTKASAKEQIIVENTEGIEEILALDYNIINKDTKISYNKVLAKADIALSILYLIEDGRIKKAEENIPVMGFIDLVGISDEDICDVKYKLKNIIAKPNAKEEHGISVEMEFEIFCRVFGNKEVSVIQDMYSPSRNLEFNQNSVSTAVNMKNTKTQINIREKVNLENDEYSKICSANAYAVINEKNVGRDMVKYTGDLNLKFILINSEETETRKEEITIPFSFNQEIEGITKDSKVDIELSQEFQEFTKDGNQVSVKIDLEALANSYNLETINIISEIEERDGVSQNVKAVEEKIAAAARAAGRDPGEIALCAATKVFGGAGDI